MNSTRSAVSEHQTRRLTAPSSDFRSRAAIEAYLDRLNQRSPMAQRDIIEWGPARTPSLQIRAVPAAAAGTAGDPIFMAEAQTSFGLDVRARCAAAAGEPYSIGVVLSGSLRVTLASGDFVARAGEGVIIDPTEIERTQFSANSHFVEFALPRSHLLRLGAELAPGELAGAPEFAPVLSQPLAQRLLFMAQQAADLLSGAE